jgi:hypothetical protein
LKNKNKILEILKKLEWAGRARGPGSGFMDSGNDGELSQCCPICGGIKPSDPFAGSWIREARGHREDCEFKDLEAILN